MKDPIIKTLLFGLGGIFVGGVEAATRHITDPVTETHLCIPFSNIHLDQQLLSVLSELDPDMQRIDHVAAVRTIKAIDELVGLRHRLCTNKYEPLMKDRVQGVVYFRKAKSAIQRFISRAEVLEDARKVIHIQRLTQIVMRQLDTHLKSVIISTRDMNIYP